MNELARLVPHHKASPRSPIRPPANHDAAIRPYQNNSANPGLYGSHLSVQDCANRRGQSAVSSRRPHSS
jgi:hypothetical protein